MADNSLNSLLDWMKNSPNGVMWGWDAIAAMARSKTNTLLIQEYIARFTTGSYLSPVSGVVEITVGQREERLQDFLLDAPRLSFERLDPDDPSDHPRALLTCAIMGGMQVTMEHVIDSWRAVKVVETDPLQGPRLILELNLADVQGNVGADGRVIFDLRHSDNFKLTFGQTETEQALGGQFFKELFNQLPDEKRIWVLGHIADGGEPSLRAQSFKLGVQANSLASRNPRDGSYGDGALLICICMVGSQQGAGLPAEYRYLIPDDAGKNYSSTVLFGEKRITDSIDVVDHVVNQVAQLIESREFTVKNDADGNFLSAEAKSGGLSIEASGTRLVDIVIGGETIEVFVIRSGAFFSASAPEPLRIYSDENKAICVEWHSASTQETTIQFTGGYPNSKTSFKYTLDVKASFSVTEENNDLVVKPILEINIDHEKIESLSERSDGDWLIAIGLILVQIARLTKEDIKPKILAALEQGFAASTSITSFIKESIQLTFGNAIQSDTIRAPRDIGVFGRINPTQTSFTTTPLEPLVAAGGSKSFSTEPKVSGLTWQVKALESDNTPGLGTINSSGVYTAPSASAITGRFHRERVVARHSSSGFYSSALVTVLANQLTINPLIQLCDVTSTVELAAGALSGGDLQWSVRSAEPAEAGTVAPSQLPDGDHTYTPHAKVANKTYVLDEVVVSNGQDSRSAWVLVRQKQSVVTVKPLPAAGLPAGQVKLQAILNDLPQECAWSLPMNGPGKIDESTGIYTADAQANERFVLIFGVVDGGGFGKFEGHIILPLPLGDFESELDMMKA